MQATTAPKQRRLKLNNAFSNKKRSPVRTWKVLLSFLALPFTYIFVTNAALSRSSSDNILVTTGTSNTVTAPQASNPATIAYAISLTGCPATVDDQASLIDGAAILAHSIHLNSNQSPNSQSNYNYKLYAIVHPKALTCASNLEPLGFTVLERDVPVAVEDIEGDYLREKVVTNGCCGEMEFIKLWAYTLVEHPIVVHLDLDTFLLQPLDHLFDRMLVKDATATTGDHGDEPRRTNVLPDVMWPEERDIQYPDAFFTRDYNMVNAGRRPVGVQGGFLVARTSLDTFKNYQQIILEGNFGKKGWGDLGFGPFYGSMTFQGIVPYFYDAIHPHHSMELNRCVYNTMADNPRDKRTVNDVVSGKCRDGREDCEDCRDRPLEDVKTAHFTLCQKPWTCLPHGENIVQDRLCRKLFGEWFRVRADLELSWQKRSLVEEEGKNGETIVVGEGKFQAEHFRGFCTRSGQKGYIPLDVSTKQE